jgi:hypothetical protein
MQLPDTPQPSMRNVVVGTLLTTVGGAIITGLIWLLNLGNRVVSIETIIPEVRGQLERFDKKLDRVLMEKK